jgi:HK97 family phage portal protein
MGFFDAMTAWFRPEPKASYGPMDDYWFTSRYQSPGGFNISAEGSLNITAVYACIRIIADTVASLPLDLYRRIEGGKELANSHSLYDLLKYQPNRDQDAYQFFERLIIDCNTRGFFYAEKVFQQGRIVELRPLQPDWVTIQKLSNGWLRYEYNDNLTGKHRVYRPDELFRVQMFTGPDGYTPISPIRYNADAIGITESMERFAGSYFRHGAAPGGILELPMGVKITPEIQKAIKESWNREHQGPDSAHKIAVLDNGMKFTPINLSNEDSQLIESRRFQLADIARIFRVPLHMIQELEKSSFNNIEHQSLDFGIHTIRPWTKRIQQAIRRDILFEDEKKLYYAEFNMNDLLSADAKSRAEFYSNAIQNGFMTRNEVRERENLNPLPGLDEPLQPLNMVTQAEKERDMQLKEEIARQPQEAPAPAEETEEDEPTQDEDE